MILFDNMSNHTLNIQYVNKVQLHFYYDFHIIYENF